MKILLAIDDSEFSEAAIQSIIQQRRPENVQVCLLHAQPSLPLLMLEFSSRDALDSITTVNQQRQEQAKKLVQRWEEALRKAGFRTEGVVKDADPRSAIIDHAAEWGADLIVVGSHGRRGLNRLLLGSVAEFVARHARCSVEIVRLPAAAKP